MTIRSSAWQHTPESTANAASTASDAARSAASQGAEALANAEHKAEELAELAAGRARELFDTLGQQSRAGATAAREFAREHPVALVAGAFAAGLLIASLRSKR